jgi:1-acyl-sn-glycerol-3-phosphate acyltransferase
MRSVFWDQVLRVLAGGVGVAGTAPEEPSIVVANHSSHADTAALIAVLGARRPVLVVAGGDYWRGWRGWLARNVIGILPIDREGGLQALLKGAGEHLRSGGTVVLFPEGTRTTDGTIGVFKAGAVRLAASVEVPLVPVGIRGTRELYGKGRLLPDLTAPKNAPLSIRIGTPVEVKEGDDIRAVAKELRTAVCELAEEPAAPVSSSATWEWAQVNLSGWRGVAFSFGWALAEGMFLPFVAEAGIAPVALAHGRKAWPAVAAAAAGSVVGVAANWGLARAGVRVPWPLTTPEMHAAARVGLLRDVPDAMRQQRGNSIPVKVYARTAGELGVPPGALIAATAVARASRLIPVGAAWVVAGQVGQDRLRVRFGAALTGTAVGVAIGLQLMNRRWNWYR